MFLSVVTKMSKPASSARASSSPLLRVSHPRVFARCTVWPASERASPRGVPWSKSSSILLSVRRYPIQTAGDKFQHVMNLFVGYIELFDDFINGHTGGKVLEHDRNGHACSPKNPCPAHFAGYAFHGGTL